MNRFRHRLQNLPLAHKLVGLVVVIGSLVLLVALAAQLTLLVSDRRQMAQEQIESLARLMAESVGPAVAFGDAAAAARALAPLAGQGVDCAWVRLPDGRRFAGLGDCALPVADAAATQVSLLHARASAATPVALRGETLATAGLTIDLQTERHRIVVTALLMGGVSLLAVLAAWALALRLQRMVLAPIHQLGDAVRTISQGGTYDTRLPVVRGDELGELTRQFNQMLAELERRGAEMERYSATLEIEVAQRTRELVAMRDAATEANEAKSRFLANMSHEIRTPMNAIIGLTELTLNKPLPVDVRQHLAVVQHSATGLLSILNDVLDFSKIEAGRLSLESLSFDVHELVAQTVDLVRLEASRRRVAVQVQIDDAVPRLLLGDPVRLRQIVANLLNNAVKFTEDGEVRVDLRAAPAEDGLVDLCIEVADTGIGMSPQTLDGLFDAFRQADDSTTRRFGGTGLGLAICQQLSRLMGGTISARSVLGRGSTFSCRLPLQPAPPAEAAAAPAWPAGREFRCGPAVRLLLVEDNPVNVLVASAMLETYGYSLDVAEDGAQALERLQHVHYDLVLMDCQMPVLDGYQAVRRWREHEGACGMPRLPVLALTANAMVGEAERSLEAGFDGHLVKPMSGAMLAQALRQWLPLRPGDPPASGGSVAVLGASPGPRPSDGWDRRGAGPR